MLISSATYSQQVIFVDFIGSKIAYAPAIHKIFAAGHPSGESDYKLYEIDAITGSLKIAFDFNLDIDALAVSADGSLLYVGLRHLDSSVVVVNLPSMTIANVFSVRPNQSSPVYIIRKIFPSPNDPELVAISRKTSAGDFGDFVLYDHGVPRQNTIGTIYSTLYWSANSPVIYVTTGSELFLLEYDSQGLFGLDTAYQSLTSSVNMVSYNDRIYTAEGTVIDIKNKYPVLFGRFPPYFTFHGTWVDQDNHRIIQAKTGNEIIHLYTYDPVRLTLLGPPVPVPSHGQVFKQYMQLGTGSDFAAWAEGELMIVHFCTTNLPAPAIDPKYDEPVILCIGTPIVIPTPPGYNYVIDQDGMYHDSLVITTQGIYTIRIADANGCLSPPSKQIRVDDVFTTGKPSIRIWDGDKFTYTGAVNRCINGSTLFDASGANADWYEWSNGYIGDSLITDQTGNFWVYGISADGCKSVASDIIHVNALPLPAPDPPEILSKDGTNGCNNHSTIVLIAEDGYTDYHWSFGKTNWKSKNINITNTSTKSISLRGRNAQGCWSQFNTVDVFFYDIDPVTPHINVQFNLLSSSVSANAYQWFLNDVAIPDSDKPAWKANIPGDYKVRAFDGVCWSNLSLSETVH